MLLAGPYVLFGQLRVRRHDDARLVGQVGHEGGVEAAGVTRAVLCVRLDRVVVLPLEAAHQQLNAEAAQGASMDEVAG